MIFRNNNSILEKILSDTAMNIERNMTSEAGESPKPEFIRKIEARWEQGFFVCVGLDTNYALIPEAIKRRSVGRAMFRFNQEIVDATSSLVCAYKPNAAFYEEWGEEGLEALEKTCAYIREKHPGIPVIFDAKRADIGKTNNGYVRAAFEYLDADAITVNPYLGQEALKPFLDKKNKGILVLTRTSNQGAGEFQDLPVNLKDLPEDYKKTHGDLKILAEVIGSWTAPLYQVVAFAAAKNWNINGNVGLVAGATYPSELGLIRKIAGDVPMLIPGIGTQGGDIRATVTNGKDSRGWGIIINSSSGIIYASKEADFAQKAREATLNLSQQIKKNMAA